MMNIGFEGILEMVKAPELRLFWTVSHMYLFAGVRIIRISNFG
jgi:hypothetical protein